MEFTIDFLSLKGRVFSQHLNRSVTFRWVAPPTYRKSNVLLPVLLMNDGQDFTPMALERTLTAAFRDTTLRPFLYIGIETDENRMHEYGISASKDFKGRGNKAYKYRKFIIEEFIPFIKKEFKASDKKKEWVFCGMSLGGLSAFDIVLNNPSSFGKVGVFSGSFWWRKKPYLKSDKEDRSRIILDVIKNVEADPDLKFWLQCGTLDETADRNQNGIIDSINDTLDVIQELQKKGFSNKEAIRYVELQGGKHNLSTWAGVFPKFLEWAFLKTKQSKEDLI